MTHRLDLHEEPNAGFSGPGARDQEGVREAQGDRVDQRGGPYGGGRGAVPGRGRPFNPDGVVGTPLKSVQQWRRKS